MSNPPSKSFNKITINVQGKLSARLFAAFQNMNGALKALPEDQLEIAPHQQSDRFKVKFRTFNSDTAQEFRDYLDSLGLRLQQDLRHPHNGDTMGLLVDGKTATIIKLRWGGAQ